MKYADPQYDPFDFRTCLGFVIAAPLAVGAWYVLLVVIVRVLDALRGLVR